MGQNEIAGNDVTREPDEPQTITQAPRDPGEVMDGAQSARLKLGAVLVGSKHPVEKVVEQPRLVKRDDKERLPVRRERRVELEIGETGSLQFPCITPLRFLVL